MEEIRHKVHVLSHQSEACLQTAQGRHRTHGYSMISDQAKLEHDLVKKREGKLAQMLDKTMGKCVACIKMTAATGRTAFCITRDLENIGGEIEKKRGKAASEWTEIKSVDLSSHEKKK